jgi:hypothetical protein
MDVIQFSSDYFMCNLKSPEANYKACTRRRNVHIRTKNKSKTILLLLLLIIIIIPLTQIKAKSYLYTFINNANNNNNNNFKESDYIYVYNNAECNKILNLFSNQLIRILMMTAITTKMTMMMILR